ncbi:hypothetical protein D3C76_1110770 [compost metagenome]
MGGRVTMNGTRVSNQGISSARATSSGHGGRRCRVSGSASTGSGTQPRRRQVGQQRQADGQGGQAGGGPDQQGGIAPTVLGRVAAQQQGRLLAVDQQADRQQHAVEHETQQFGEVPQVGMATGTPERPPAHRDAEGFRQRIERRPVPVHVPEGHTEQGVEIDGGQYPSAPPEAEHQSEGERQVPDGQAAGDLRRKGNPGGQMQQRQGQPPGPLG